MRAIKLYKDKEIYNKLCQISNKRSLGNIPKGGTEIACD